MHPMHASPWRPLNSHIEPSRLHSVVAFLAGLQISSFVFRRTMTSYLLVFVCFVCATWGMGRPGEVDMNIKSMNVENVDNELFGDWEVKVDGGKQISVKFAVLKDVPEDATVHIRMEMNGDELCDKEMDLCEALKDKTVVEDFVKKGEPEGEFPKECPIKAGNYEVNAYEVDPQKYQGLPDGTMKGEFEFFAGDGTIIKKLNFEADISR